MKNISWPVVLIMIAVGVYMAWPSIKAVDKDVVKDLRVLQVQVEKLENKVLTDIRKDFNLLKLQLENLKSCGCKESDKCSCGDNKKPIPSNVDQWFQSSTGPNVMYFGHIGEDGVLYYTFWSVNGVTVKAGANDVKKTKDFIK